MKCPQLSEDARIMGGTRVQPLQPLECLVQLPSCLMHRRQLHRVVPVIILIFFFALQMPSLCVLKTNINVLYHYLPL